ncbi:RNA polymerase subunit sigma, partial [Clostridium botulinum]|nr:RNA polymerase subunit sigma [Clostridium botulinum]
IEERDFSKDIYKINLQEINLEGNDFNEIDMEKLKKNSINIDMEYDMNSKENDFYEIDMEKLK